MKVYRSLSLKLQSAIRVLILVALFFTSMGYAYAKTGSCVARKIALKSLFENGYAYVGTFITSQNMVAQLYFSRDGRWAWIGVTPDIEYCILMMGVEYSLAAEREG